MVRHPADDRRSDGRTAERDREAYRHHAATHGRLGGRLHQLLVEFLKVSPDTAKITRVMPNSQ